MDLKSILGTFRNFGSKVYTTVSDAVGDVIDWASTPFKDATDAKEKLFKAVNDACADGVLTADEMAEVQKLQGALKISDADMKEIKVRVLQTLFEKISADNVVTAEEKKLYEEVKAGLDLKDEDSSVLGDLYEKVKTLFTS